MLAAMPWMPELFSAPALERILDERRHERLTAVPYFDGLITGETDALVESFAGEPELHHPVRGRIKGAQPFGRFVTTPTPGSRSATSRSRTSNSSSALRHRGGRPSHRRRRWVHRASLGPCRRPRRGRPHPRAARVLQHLAVDRRAPDPAAAPAARP